MKKLNKLLAQLIIVIVSTFIVFNVYPQETKTHKLELNYEDVLNYLITLDADSLIADGIFNIEIKRDVGVFKLINGQIYSCGELDGRKTAVLFIGNGVFSFVPPTQVERDQLFRFYETDSIKKSFEYLFLLFADTTYQELCSEVKFEKKEDLPWEVENIIDDCKEYLINNDIGYAHSDFIRAFLEEEENELFYSQIGIKGEDPLFFHISPYEDEEVFFMKKGKTTGLIESQSYHEVINQFRISDSKSKNTSHDNSEKNIIKIDNYRITSNITDGLDFSAECVITFHTIKPGRKWLNFQLYSELEVDSVYTETGEKINFYRGESNSELWIKCNEELALNKWYTFKIYYQGDLLEKNELGWIQLKSPDYWYPRYGNRELETYKLVFHSPKDYTLLSTGEKESESENEEIITSKWVCKNPVRNASFHIGKYEELKIAEENFPEVFVYRSKYGQVEVSKILLEHEILTSRDEQEDIGNDVFNSVKLFQTLFGKIPLKKLYVTEIPYSHGEAFPGLIHLSWITYQGIDFDGSDEIFRSHEVAHQWWGINVDFKSYHDQWLSEGLSQYSGLMYLQAIFGNNDLFFETLDRWRDEIINNRNYLFTTGQQAGPIWLGYRTNSSDTEGDYLLIIYKKAAWVFHMLRNMLLNLQTMNEDSFTNMMKDYFNSYSGKKASTEDFKQIVDKHFGENMNWFFNQYIYGTNIPFYKFAYKYEETINGKFLVTCRVDQEEVPENFKMYVPILVKFNGDRYARVRVMIQGKQSIFNLPLLPEEPEDIIFNDLDGVLCNVDYEDWD